MNQYLFQNTKRGIISPIYEFEYTIPIGEWQLIQLTVDFSHNTYYFKRITK